MASNKNRKRDATTPDKAVTWSQRHSIAEEEQQKLFDKFRDFFDIMYAVRSTKNMAPWRSKIYVPILAGKAWDFIAKLADVTPKFLATITEEWSYDENGQPVFDETMLDRADKISKLLAYDYENPFQEISPREIVYSLLVDAVVTGTGVAKVPWNVQTRVDKGREALNDGYGSVDMENEIHVTTDQGHNSLEPVSVFNFKPAPNSPSIQGAPWLIIDGRETLDELKRDGNNDAKKLAGIDAEFRSGNDVTDAYEVSRNRLLNNGSDKAIDSTVKYLKTHECYERNAEGQVVICKYVEAATSNPEASSWVLIREMVDPYWHNKYPVQSFHIRKKPYSVWGESMFENNDTLQYATNDVINHYMENWSLSVDGMIMQEENSIVDDYIVGPGETLIYRGEKPDQFKFPEPNPQQLSTAMNTFNAAIEAATVSQYTSGTPDSDLDTTAGTAHGIDRIMSAAEDKLGFMRSNFKDSLRGVGNMWLSNRQQFMDRQEVIPVNNNGTQTPMVASPEDMQGVAAITIDDDSLIPVSKTQQLKQFADWYGWIEGVAEQAFKDSQLKGTPTINIDRVRIAQEGSMRFGMSEFNKYISPGEPVPPPQEPDPSQKLVENMNYKDVPEDIKRQIEQAAGYSPSQGVSPAGTNQAAVASNAAHTAVNALSENEGEQNGKRPTSTGQKTSSQTRTS